MKIHPETDAGIEKITIFALSKLNAVMTVRHINNKIADLSDYKPGEHGGMLDNPWFCRLVVGFYIYDYEW